MIICLRGTPCRTSIRNLLLKLSDELCCSWNHTQKWCHCELTHPAARWDTRRCHLTSDHEAGLSLEIFGSEFDLSGFIQLDVSHRHAVDFPLRLQHHLSGSTEPVSMRFDLPWTVSVRFTDANLGGRLAWPASLKRLSFCAADFPLPPNELLTFGSALC